MIMQGKWKPAWLEALNTQKFFVACSFHEHAKKNEKNICCLDCCTSICPHCVAAHRVHRLLQVRRYVYHDVVRLEDLEKLINCSSVQSYTINSSKVVFLKKRPQNRQFKGSGNICTSCDRSLQEPYFHCSLDCKVEYILRQKKNLSAYLRPCKILQLGPDFFIPHDADDETTHSTLVDVDEPMGSSDSDNLSTQCTNFVRKKRSGPYFCARSANRVSDDDMATNMSRRKGVPHRSPLC
ncbi:protein RGF1 INDUCIBLE TRANSCRIPTION FACTOR 1-like isoform X1 [Phragmites australis]|uniref:protein RGF1 INDUCIBLE TRANSCRIPTION FACTOR 1-like isoform X1 n=1 Tax=Phragmites australis TaxID=29695 RepID=UPI002D77C595|nr:protein RGF1 INDUCIBLE TRANSCRIPTION FACTOR 1-like isoform X1 [Phragmites australis]